METQLTITKIRRAVCAATFAVLCIATINGHDAMNAENAEQLKHAMEHVHEIHNHNHNNVWRTA